MKLPKKLLWILIPLLVLILLFFLVQHIKYEMNTPNRLKPAWMIPKADQSDVGKTVSLSFQSIWDNDTPRHGQNGSGCNIAYIRPG